jgi:uncharacterized protein (DUF305 family)
MQAVTLTETIVSLSNCPNPRYLARTTVLLRNRRHYLGLAAAAVLITAAAGRIALAQSTTGTTSPDSSRPRYVPADVRFMQGMIAHHGQALAMTALVPTHTTRPDLQLLAQRIEVSQRDEIAMMRRWLVDHGEMVPDSAAHMSMGPGAHAMLMPGMLSPEQMARLSNASGAEFDHLFLDGMIHHHEGALVMVKELFATSGAAQVPEVFRFASDVDTDQRAEIRRMRALLSGDATR